MFAGKFSVKAYKTSKPEEKRASHLGMIAGGTGKRLLRASSQVSPEPLLTWESLDPRRGDVSDSFPGCFRRGCGSVIGPGPDPVCPAPLHQLGGWQPRNPGEPLKSGWEQGGG